MKYYFYNIIYLDDKSTRYDIWSCLWRSPINQLVSFGIASEKEYLKIITNYNLKELTDYWECRIFWVRCSPKYRLHLRL